MHSATRKRNKKTLKKFTLILQFYKLTFALRISIGTLGINVMYMELAINETVKYFLKTFYIHSMLSLNENFDDDLLQDVVEMIDYSEKD